VTKGQQQPSDRQNNASCPGGLGSHRGYLALFVNARSSAMHRSAAFLAVSRFSAA
jgi:hypothetical protein